MRYLFMCIAFTTTLAVKAQGDVFDLLDSEETTELVYATFKGTKVVNLQSIETPGEGVLQYMISHRFGSFNNDYFYNFFGLDNAQIRMQFDYGLSDRMNIGLGRSSLDKTSDVFAKYKVLRQRNGKNDFPISLTAYSAAFYSSAKFPDGIVHLQTDRLSYAHQLIVARKFSDAFSLQLTPCVIHWNLVPTPTDPNTTLHLGVSGRYKLTKRMALTGEYIHQMTNDYTSQTYYAPFAVGLDVETGGHVFQFHVTNTNAMSDPILAARNPFNASEGSLFFGFNISRVFN